MITRVHKWGNSLGLRIPKGVAEDADVVDGSRVDVRVENGRLVIAPTREGRYRLSELLAEITPENLHGEVPVGARVGREIW